MAVEILLPPALWLTLYALVGWRIASRAIAPVAFLYFSIPIWSMLVPILQRLSVAATETVLMLAGVPADVSEYAVSLPSGTFAIVEGCSGLRYFVVALAIATLSGVVHGLRGWRFLTLVATGGALAMIANWMRIFVVIYAGHVTDMRHYLVETEHRTFGNIVFVLLLAVVYFVSRVLASRNTARALTAVPQSRPAAGRREARGIGSVLPFMLLAAVLAFTLVPSTAPRGSIADLGPLPLSTGAWQGPVPGTRIWEPDYVLPTHARRGAYTARTGELVQVYVNYYRQQLPGAELVFYRNTLLAPGQWTRNWPQASDRIRNPHGHALRTFEARSPDGRTWQLGYVYKVGRWITGSDLAAQGGYGWQSLLAPVPAGVAASAVLCEDNCLKAQALMRAFWEDMSTPILGMIPDRAP